MNAITVIKRVLRDTRAATAIEYGLIASMIVIASVAGMSAFANEVNGMWTRVQTEVENAR